MQKLISTLAVALVAAAPVLAQNLAGDEVLSKVLIEGEGWQEIGSGFGMTDGACNDAEGNLYFSESNDQRIRKVSNGIISTSLSISHCQNRVTAAAPRRPRKTQAVSWAFTAERTHRSSPSILS